MYLGISKNRLRRAVNTLKLYYIEIVTLCRIENIEIVSSLKLQHFAEIENIEIASPLKLSHFAEIKNIEIANTLKLSHFAEIENIEIANLSKLYHIFLGRAARASWNCIRLKLQDTFQYEKVEIVDPLKLHLIIETQDVEIVVASKLLIS